ncbi:MAG TPA: carboxypeptidase-like regulatory domain-containing protein [Vicinamibacterales bacterium]|nr:carboxypeptidase-like regulatory domain-containing protein [Vicinamibacterales bacterium]
MRRALGTALGVALLATGPAAGQQEAAGRQAAATGTAAISGVVSDAVTGRPIAGAGVSLFGVEPGGQELAIRLSVLTDTRGRFVFVNLPSAPRYTLIATHPSYAVGDYARPAGASTGALIRVDDQDLSITLADGEWMREANIRMFRLGAIGGRVTDERGEALVGAAVRIFSHRMVAGRQQLVPGAVVATDDRGVYRIPRVQPGRYFVAVLSVQATVPVGVADGPRTLPLGGLETRRPYTPPGSPPDARGASVDVNGRHRLVLTNFATPPPPGGDRQRAYAPAFYPNARTLSEAQGIDLDVGASRADVDFQLAPVPTATVSGRVTRGVEGAANMLLRLMAPGSEHLGFGSEMGTTLVEADGSFTFLNVPAGAYTLVASPAVADTGGSPAGRLAWSVGYGPALGLSMVYEATGTGVMWWRSEAGATVWGRMPVSVGDANVTGLELALQRSASVRGRVVFDDSNQPDPAQRFLIMLEPANADTSLGVPNTHTAAYDETHAFSIGGLQDGRYLVRFQPFRGWRVKSVLVNGIDVTDTGLDGSLGQDYDKVLVTVTKAGAALSGVVRDRDGRPAAGAVILFPVDPQRWVDYGLTPDRLKSTSARSSGAYALSPISEGDYYVVAVPQGQGDAWQDPKFLAAAVPAATRISLTTGDARSQDLRVSEVVVR